MKYWREKKEREPRSTGLATVVSQALRPRLCVKRTWLYYRTGKRRGNVGEDATVAIAIVALTSSLGRRNLDPCVPQIYPDVVRLARPGGLDATIN